MASIYGFTIKRVKKFMGRDTEGSQGDIWYGSKKIGWYNNSGDGGQSDIDFTVPFENREKYRQLLKECTDRYFKEYPLQEPYSDIIPDEEIFMAELLTMIDREKIYKSLSKKGYPYVIMFSGDGGYSEKHVGFLTESDAHAYAAKEKLSDYRLIKDINAFTIT